MESSNLQITKHVEALQKIKNLIAGNIKYHEDQINKLKELKYTQITYMIIELDVPLDLLE